MAKKCEKVGLYFWLKIGENPILPTFCGQLATLWSKMKTKVSARKTFPFKEDKKRPFLAYFWVVM